MNEYMYKYMNKELYNTIFYSHTFLLNMFAATLTLDRGALPKTGAVFFAVCYAIKP